MKALFRTCATAGIRPVAVAVLALLLPAAATAEIVSVAARMANLRAGPGGSYRVVEEAWIYSPFRVLERKGSWVHVEDFEGFDGWLHRSVVSDAPAVVVRTRKANMRSGPGAGHDVSWVVEQGYPFLVIERQGSWLKVRDDGEIEGWIHRSVVWGNTQAVVSDPDLTAGS